MSLTLQQVFNNAYRGLKSQGFQRCTYYMASDLTGGCCYDNKHGKHCAIGWSLPPGSKLNKVVGGIDCLVYDNAEEFYALFGHIDIEQLKELQNIHDVRTLESNMKERLEEFAKRY
jgi:hypothetical protein